MPEASRFPRPFGKYLLLRQLAVGGMAEVYLARQSGPAGFEKECVIKRILPSLALDAQFVQMFLDEARIAARLAHPNIVQIFDLGQLGDEDGRDYFIAMEHVAGVDLQQIVEAEMARGGRVPLSLALRLISNVAEGLDHAHRATDSRGVPLGIVHRDVTPSNVIVSFDGVAKILDFGIAKAVARGPKTEVGIIKGKVPYMSPEQIQGEPLDARSDLFSLGTMLYEITVGQKPFPGHNTPEISLQILNGSPEPPEAVIPHYPPALSAIVMHALAKRRDDRFASARDLQVAIEEFLVSSGIRCSSHEVAGYLQDLFPGRRDAERHQLAPPPVVASNPTVPMHTPVSRRERIFGSGPNLAEEGAPGELLEGHLSSQLNAGEEVRRSFGGGGGGGGLGVVVVLLVAAVAFGFWYLRSRSPTMGTSSEVSAPAAPHAPAPSAAVEGTPSPAAPEPHAAMQPVLPGGPSLPPTVPPVPSLAEKGAGGESGQHAASTHDTGEELSGHPEPNTESGLKAKAPPSGHKAVARPKPAKAHSSKPAPADEPMRALPRLPTPPPADGNE